MRPPSLVLLLALAAPVPMHVEAASCTTPPPSVAAGSNRSSSDIQVKSITEGVITSDFVDEATMKGDLLQMLARFSEYLKNDFQECASPNSLGEACGCFRSNSTMQANEDGVRSNADLGMIAAFLVKYGKGKVTLPDGVTWSDLEAMARKSLVFAYSTHKANRLKVCSGNSYWGSTGVSDHTWEEFAMGHVGGLFGLLPVGGAHGSAEGIREGAAQG